MAHESFSVSEVIPAPPDQIYEAWLDAATHSAFTGEDATVEPFVGGKHTSFGGYSEGTMLELSPGRRIVQTWRSKDFPDGSPDSRIEVTLEETLGGTMVTILHSEIPTGQGEQYREGWVKYYLQALKQYFSGEDAADEGADESASDGVLTVELPVETMAPPPKPAANKNGTHKAQRAASSKVPATKAVKAKARKSAAKSAKAAKAKKPAAKARKPAAKKKPAAKARKAAPKKKAAAAKKPAKKAAKKSAKKKSKR